MSNLPDSGTLADFGGVALANYANLPPSNPNTDVDNTKLANCFSDVSGIKLVVARVAVVATLASTSAGIVINHYFSNWLNVNNTLPITSRTSTGIFVFTFPTVVGDEYNVSVGINNNHTVNLQMSLSHGFIGTSFGFINTAITSPNQITVYTANTSGIQADFAGTKIFFTAR
jgi:hypothetical protein